MKYHRIDGWRGYPIPARAVLGASDCGTAPDSPCPTPIVLAEIAAFRKVLRANKIVSRLRVGVSSNCFMIKRWVVVSPADEGQAKSIAAAYLEATKNETRFIHDAS
jgi:hypothetical protein